MMTTIRSKQELAKAIARPEVTFRSERAVYTERQLTELVNELRRLLREGKQLHLAVLENNV